MCSGEMCSVCLLISTSREQDAALRAYTPACERRLHRLAHLHLMLVMRQGEGGTPAPVVAELAEEVRQKLAAQEEERAVLAQTRLEMEATRVLLERCHKRERYKRQGELPVGPCSGFEFR